MFPFYAFFSVLLTVSPAAHATTLTVKILDESGFPATARVYLTDKKGQSHFPAGALVYKRMNWNIPEEHFFRQVDLFPLNFRRILTRCELNAARSHPGRHRVAGFGECGEGLPSSALGEYGQ
jgi:hypothetical protein